MNDDIYKNIFKKLDYKGRELYRTLLEEKPELEILDVYEDDYRDNVYHVIANNNSSKEEYTYLVLNEEQRVEATKDYINSDIEGYMGCRGIIDYINGNLDRDYCIDYFSNWDLVYEVLLEDGYGNFNDIKQYLYEDQVQIIDDLDLNDILISDFDNAPEEIINKFDLIKLANSFGVVSDETIDKLLDRQDIDISLDDFPFEDEEDSETSEVVDVDSSFMISLEDSEFDNAKLVKGILRSIADSIYEYEYRNYDSMRDDMLFEEYCSAIGCLEEDVIEEILKHSGDFGDIIDLGGVVADYVNDLYDDDFGNILGAYDGSYLETDAYYAYLEDVEKLSSTENESLNEADESKSSEEITNEQQDKINALKKVINTKNKEVFPSTTDNLFVVKNNKDNKGTFNVEENYYVLTKEERDKLLDEKLHDPDTLIDIIKKSLSYYLDLDGVVNREFFYNYYLDEDYLLEAYDNYTLGDMLSYWFNTPRTDNYSEDLDNYCLGDLEYNSIPLEVLMDFARMIGIDLSNYKWDENDFSLDGILFDDEDNQTSDTADDEVQKSQTETDTEIKKELSKKITEVCLNKAKEYNKKELDNIKSNYALFSKYALDYYYSSLSISVEYVNRDGDFEKIINVDTLANYLKDTLSEETVIDIMAGFKFFDYSIKPQDNIDYYIYLSSVYWLGDED